MAGGAEAGDRGGVVCAGLVGLGNCPALRRKCEPGIWLAEALSRRPSCAGRPVGSSTDAGGGYGGTGCCRHATNDGRGEIEIDLAGKYRVRVSSGVDAQVLRRVLDVLERR